MTTPASITQNTSIQYRQLSQADFEQVISLGNAVHGDSYLDHAHLNEIFLKGFNGDLNCSWVAYSGDQLVGFRLTFAPGMWEADQFTSVEDYPADLSKICYFKCNTVDPICRGKGVGKTLLNKSIEVASQMGAIAGIAHIWMQSPGNSAYEYFSKSGGRLIKIHPRKWQADCDAGYECTICGSQCYCDAAEMIIEF